MTEQEHVEISWSQCREAVKDRFADLVELIELLGRKVDGYFDELESLSIQEDEEILGVCEEIDTILSKFPTRLAGAMGYVLTRDGWSIDEFGGEYTKRAYEAVLADIAREQIKQSKYVPDGSKPLEAVPPKTESPTDIFKAATNEITKNLEGMFTFPSDEGNDE